MYSAIENRITALTNANAKRVFNQVKSALNLAVVKTGSVPKPYCAYVVPVSDSAKNLMNDASGSIEQITTTFGIVVGIQSRNDPTGEKGNQLLQSVLTDLRISLMAYSPKLGYSGCKLAGGNLLNMSDNGIWWLEKFSTTYNLESSYDQ